MDGNDLRTLTRDAQSLVDSLDHHPVLGPVIRGDASREEYLRFLRSTYHYVRWSGPLLAETGEGLRRRGGAAWLVDLFEAKTAEESPHVRWVLADLRSFGVNVELVKASAAPRAVSAYVEQSRSLAESGSPGFLGAAYVLEFISAHRAGTAARNLRKRAGIAHIEAGVSFLDGHGDADVGHVALLERLLLRIDDPQDQDDICLAAKQMQRLYPRFFVSAAPLSALEGA